MQAVLLRFVAFLSCLIGFILRLEVTMFFFTCSTYKFMYMLCLSFLIVGMGCGNSYANISVYPMTIVLDKQNMAALEVQSLSEEPTYISVTVKRIIYTAGSVEPVEQDIQLYNGGIFAVPNRMVLPPRGKRSVRFVSNTPPEEYERSYRVYIETVPPLDDGISVADSTQRTSLAVNVIWGALLFVPPIDRKVSLLYENGILKNLGNTFLRIISASVCSGSGDCKRESFAVPPLPPLGQFDVRPLLAGYLSTKEITLTYEDRSSQTPHEIKITPLGL